MTFYTITASDVSRPVIRAFGRIWLVYGFLGRVLPQDVGKRVYWVCDTARPRGAGILQVENREQFEARTQSEGSTRTPGHTSD